MAKVDLRHAYRSVNIHPSNYAATGLKWNFSNSDKFTYLFDTKLSYGGRRAPGIFHRLTQAVKRFMAKRGYRSLVVYLDDFLIIGATYAECLKIFNSLVELLQELGFQISWHKAVPPTQALIFLGILINSVTQTLELPQDKLVALQDLVQAFLHRRRASKRQLQSLAGKLSWACRVVYGGRTFLRRILDVMNAMLSSSARYRLSPEFYADLAWWAEFLRLFNGKQLLLDSRPVVDVQTDACFDGMGGGGGGVYAGDWAYVHFASALPHLSDLHITQKETLAVVMAAERWAPAWSNRHVIIHCDNHTAVSIINKGSTPNAFILPYLRRLFWLSACFNFRITARYIPGHSNCIADALSRMHDSRFLRIIAFAYLCQFFPIACFCTAANASYALR